MSKKGPGQPKFEGQESKIPDFDLVRKSAAEKYRIKQETGEALSQTLDEFTYAAVLDAAKTHDERLLLKDEFPGCAIISVPHSVKGGEFLAYPYVSQILGIDGDLKDLSATFPQFALLEFKKGDFLVIQPDKREIKVVNASSSDSGLLTINSDRSFARNDKMWAKVSGEAEKSRVARLMKDVDYNIGDKYNVEVTFKSKEALKKLTLPDLFNSKAIKVNGQLAVKIPEKGNQYFYVNKGELTNRRALVLNGTIVSEVLTGEEERVVQKALGKFEDINA